MTNCLAGVILFSEAPAACACSFNFDGRSVSCAPFPSLDQVAVDRESALGVVEAVRGAVFDGDDTAVGLPLSEGLGQHPGVRLGSRPRLAASPADFPLASHYAAAVTAASTSASGVASSTNRHSAFTKRICSTVRYLDPGSMPRSMRTWAL